MIDEVQQPSSANCAKEFFDALPREISQVVSDKLDLCTTLKFATLNKLGNTIAS